MAMMTVRSCLAALALAAASLPVTAAGEESGARPARYVVYNTGIVCRMAPCFSYCARDLGTNEVSRFSQWELSSLQADEREAFNPIEPLVVEGTLRRVGHHVPPAVEMTVLHVVRKAPELAIRPGQCG